MAPISMKITKKDQTQTSNDCLKLVLIGKTGSGKSTSGNTILGRKQFESKLSASSVTRECKCGIAEIYEGEGPNQSPVTKTTRGVQVVDMPGFGDTHLTEDQIHTEIAKCVSLSAPGLHAFLLIVPLGRFTDFENQAACKVAEIFGEDALRHHTIVVFTKGDELEEMKIEQYLKATGTENLNALIDRCGGRYHVLNNKDQQNRAQVKELIEKVDKLQGQRGLYTNASFRVAEAAIREEKERSKGQKQETMSMFALSPKVIERVKIVVAAVAAGVVVGVMLGAAVPLAAAGSAYLVGNAIGLAGSAAVVTSTTSVAVGAVGGILVGGAIGYDAGRKASSCKEGALNALFQVSKVGAGTVASAVVGGVLGAGGALGPSPLATVKSLTPSGTSAACVVAMAGSVSVKVVKNKDMSSYEINLNKS